MTELYPPPTWFGLPAERFPSWRAGQFEGIQKSLSSSKRFVVQEMPTGSGKSLTAVAEALISGRRTLILTADKALQKQYADEFGRLLVDIRGKGNYICNASEKGGEFERDFLYPVSVDDAPCQFGETCPRKTYLGCTYYDLAGQARVSQIVLGNYALWIALNRFAEGMAFGKFDLIVCDEAHELIESLTQALSVEISEEELDTLRNCRLPAGISPLAWSVWGGQWGNSVKLELDATKGRSDRFSRRRAFALSRLGRKFSQIERIGTDWIVSRSGTKALIQPVWPQQDADNYVFGAAQKVVLTSATIRPKTLELLGISCNDADYFSYPSRFPVERRPVYYYPVLRMHYGNTPEELAVWVNRTDQIIAQRLDRKGIIHTVSFARQQFLMQHSKYRHLMIGNPQGSSQLTQETVERFKRGQAPSILVSPSIDTGFDFSGVSAEYVLIPKVPYSNTNTDLARARSSRDPQYPYYTTAQTIVQMAGRAMRSESDQCETIITDEGFAPFVNKHKALLPDWFNQAIIRTDTIPPPLGKL